MEKTCFDYGKKLGFNDVKISENDIQKNNTNIHLTKQSISN